jgi:hypothetical protein
MLLMKLTFPHAQSSPATISKFAYDDFVARYITVELTLPELGSAFRRVGEFAPGMAVPETPVDKYGDLFARKNKIRFAKHTTISSPAGNVMSSKN